MHNVGKLDRTVRVIIAVVLLVLYFTDAIPSGRFGTAAIIVAGILLATSLRRCCPLYAILGMGTCGTDIKSDEATIKTKKFDV